MSGHIHTALGHTYLLPTRMGSQYSTTPTVSVEAIKKSLVVMSLYTDDS